jgi:hypothetical protein
LCYYRDESCGSAVGGWGEVVELEGFAQVKRGQDASLAGGGLGALGYLPVRGGQGDQVHSVEFVAGVAPGVVGGVLDDRDEQQRQPAQLDVAADAVLAVAVVRAQFLSAFSGISPHFRPRRHQLTAAQHRHEMDTRFTAWNEVVGLRTAA